MSTNEEILNQLRKQIREEEREAIRAEEREALRAELLAKLGDQAAAAPAPVRAAKTKVARATKRKGPGVKRSPEELAATAGKVLAFVTTHPGTNAEAIKGALGVELAEIELPIKKLLKSKLMSRKGQKRATRYYSKGKGA